MQINYALTWDEFAELHKDRWPVPDYFSAIVVFIVVVPLVGYGLALATFGAPDEPILYSMFIGGPIVLLALAVLALKSQSAQALQHAVAETRSEYDRLHARGQSFSFDDDKWMHETEAGRQEVPWSAMLMARETENVLSFTGENSSALIPKRILGIEALTGLRRFASLAHHDEWAYQIGVWDYQATVTALQWRKYWFRMAFGNCFGLGVLLWVGQNWLASTERAGVVWGWILASLAVLLTLTAQMWYLPLRYFTSAKDWRAPQKVRFSDSGIHLCHSEGGLFLTWNALRKSGEVPRAFLIYVDQTHYYLLPKRYFSVEQQAEIRRTVESKLSRE